MSNGDTRAGKQSGVVQLGHWLTAEDPLTLRPPVLFSGAAAGAGTRAGGARPWVWPRRRAGP